MIHCDGLSEEDGGLTARAAVLLKVYLKCESRYPAHELYQVSLLHPQHVRTDQRIPGWRC